VVYINYGPDAGKIAVIVDIIDQNRLFVDGPTFGVKRHVLNIKWVRLTDIVVKLSGRGTRQKALEKAIKDQDIKGKWDKTNWARNLAVRAKRRSLSDFERFKLTKAKKTRAGLVRHEIAVVIKAKNLKKHEAEERRAAKNKKSASTRIIPPPLKKGEKREKKAPKKREGKEKKAFEHLHRHRKRIVKPTNRVLRAKLAIGKGHDKPKGFATSLDRKSRFALLAKGFRLPRRSPIIQKRKTPKKIADSKAKKAPKTEKAIQKA